MDQIARIFGRVRHESARQQEMHMNEAAVPESKALFIEAPHHMSIADAKQILAPIIAKQFARAGFEAAH